MLLHRAQGYRKKALGLVPGIEMEDLLDINIEGEAGSSTLVSHERQDVTFESMQRGASSNVSPRGCKG
jgi:hypothetical protein